MSGLRHIKMDGDHLEDIDVRHVGVIESGRIDKDGFSPEDVEWLGDRDLGGARDEAVPDPKGTPARYVHELAQKMSLLSSGIRSIKSLCLLSTFQSQLRP